MCAHSSWNRPSLVRLRDLDPSSLQLLCCLCYYFRSVSGWCRLALARCDSTGGRKEVARRTYSCGRHVGRCDGVGLLEHWRARAFQ